MLIKDDLLGTESVEGAPEYYESFFEISSQNAIKNRFARISDLA